METLGMTTNNKIHIEHDECAEAPNRFTDCLVGKLYFVGHRSYTADDYPYETDVDDFTCGNDFMEALEKELPEDSIIEPVYMYSHGGQTIRRSPFSCRWDSGWVGVFVITPEEVRELRGWKRMSAKRWKIAEKDADNTFAMWKAYVEGAVFRVYVTDSDGDTECAGTAYGEDDLQAIVNDAIIASFHASVKQFTRSDVHALQTALELNNPITSRQLVESMAIRFGVEVPKITAQYESMLPW